MGALVFVFVLWFVARANSYYDNNQRIKRYIYVGNELLSKLFITKVIAHYHNGKVKKEHYNKLSYIGLAGYMLTVFYALAVVFSTTYFNGCSEALLAKTLFYLALGLFALIMLLHFMNDEAVWEKGLVAKLAAIFCDGIFAFSAVYFLRQVIIYYQILYLMKF